MGAPMSIVTVLTLPSSTVTSAPRLPLRVLIVNLLPSTFPKSYANFATHLMPLPHISASLPSALIILMVMSAPSLPGRTYSTPSAPMPKCLSHIFLQRSLSISRSSSIPLRTMKSFPMP